MDTFVLITMIEKLLYIVLISTILCSCSVNPKSITIDFGGKDHVLENRTLYLCGVYDRSVIDSTVVKDGLAVFDTKKLSKSAPTHLYVKFQTLDSMKYLLPFGIRNPFLKNNFESCFYYDQENLVLQIDTSYHGNPSLKPYTLRLRDMSKQNEIAFKHMSVRTGPGSMMFNRNLIKRYSDSMEILYTIYLNRHKMPNDEISGLLRMFTGAARNSQVFESLDLYASAPSTTDSMFPNNVVAFTPDGFDENLSIVPADWNLVVFWASWCGPCRAEIPQIRELQRKHKGELSVTSVSVDHNRDNWKKALEVENMDWPQYIVFDMSRAILEKKFDLHSIPVWLLFDKNGNLVHREMGYNEGANSLDRIVEGYILK